jgi:hypothetical protein
MTNQPYRRDAREKGAFEVAQAIPAAKSLQDEESDERDEDGRYPIIGGLVEPSRKDIHSPGKILRSRSLLHKVVRTASALFGFWPAGAIALPPFSILRRAHKALIAI